MITAVHHPNQIQPQRRRHSELWKKSFGAAYLLTKNAHRELLRIQAFEEASIPVIPMHVVIGDVELRPDKLTKKLESQKALMAQATSQYHQAEERVTELASNMAGTQTDISHAQFGSLPSQQQENTGGTRERRICSARAIP
jgi:hypothetical protein